MCNLLSEFVNTKALKALVCASSSRVVMGMFYVFQTISSTDRKSVKKYGNKLNAVGSPSRSRSSTKELRCKFFSANISIIQYTLEFLLKNRILIFFSTYYLWSVTRWSHVSTGFLYTLNWHLHQRWTTIGTRLQSNWRPRTTDYMA